MFGEITHRGLFFFGVLFYLIAPLIILQTDIFDGLPAIDPWKTNVLDSEHLFIYLALVIELVVFFYMGSYLAIKYTNPNFSTRRDLGKISSRVLLIVVGIFVSVFIFKLRASAFQGTAAFNEDDRLQGILSTANLLLFYIHFVLEQPKYTKRIFLIIFIINSIFLLGLGGRMYVIIPAVAYYIRAYNNASRRGKSVIPYIIIPLIAAISASIIGALRIGDKLDKPLYFLFAEPIFTSYSAFSYVNQNNIPLVATPYSFFVSFLNFVPSLFWSGKAEALTKLVGDWAKFDNPLGALSIFVSIYANFGIVLSAVFIFFFGALYGYLYKGFITGKINKNIYYCFCGVLPFCFFRDPLGVPIKIFITSYLIIPYLLQLFRRTLKVS
jgi:hypothetical protein